MRRAQPPRREERRRALAQARVEPPQGRARATSSPRAAVAAGAGAAALAVVVAALPRAAAVVRVAEWAGKGWVEGAVLARARVEFPRAAAARRPASLRGISFPPVASTRAARARGGTAAPPDAATPPPRNKPPASFFQLGVNGHFRDAGLPQFVQHGDRRAEIGLRVAVDENLRVGLRGLQLAQARGQLVEAQRLLVKI